MDIVISLCLIAIVFMELYQIISDRGERKKLSRRVDFHDEIINEFNVNWANNFQLWQQQHEINLKLIEKIHEIKGEEVEDIVEKINNIDPEKVRINKDKE